MKIAIIGAMEQEVALLKAQLKNLQTTEKAQCIFHTGQLNGVEVVLLQSGIGKVAASVGTTLLIECFNPDKIINTGSAGGFQADLTMGDVVISTEVRHHDADVTAFGYEMGQMAGQPAAFQADADLISLIEQVLAESDAQEPDTKKSDVEKSNVFHGLICTGDAFICTPEQQAKIRQHFPSVLAVEMEASAIAQTCHQFGVPFVVVRAISDVADKESPMSFDQFLPLAAEKSSAMVMRILAKLA